METRKLPDPVQLAPRQPRRHPIRRIVSFSFTLLSGIILGALGILLVELSLSGSGTALTTPRPPSNSDIVVQVGVNFVTHLVDQQLRASGMVSVSNVQVTMARGDQITINGDDTIIFSVTGHFSIVLQPLVRACQLQLQLIHADLAGIPVTSLVASFQDRINQELMAKLSGLPAGFSYCKTSVRTDPQEGLFITFSAKPV